MRVNPNYTADFLAAISQTQERQQVALQQLVSGKRVSVPSDDPAAAAALVQNQASQNLNAVYQQSVTSLRGQLQTADSALASIVTSLTRAVTLGTSGANDTQATNRQNIAGEVEGILEGVLQAANTQYQGVSLFAGTTSVQQAYTRDAGTGNITYNGNDDSNEISVGTSRRVTANKPGSELFGSSGVFSSLQDLIQKLKTGTSTEIQDATSQVSAALNKLSTSRVFYGNTVNQLDSAASYLQEEKLNLATEENDLVGVDITKAATDLSTAVLANNAALSAFAKTQQTNLLDYLK
jgi:flagellar hook-associated protein 3 FlgL